MEYVSPRDRGQQVENGQRAVCGPYVACCMCGCVCACVVEGLCMCVELFVSGAEFACVCKGGCECPCVHLGVGAFSVHEQI